jgi:hypothetical protein
MNKYTEKKLLGCGRSIDVVHLKWSNCPAGDYNRSLGKEGYPTLAFEVVTGNNRNILGISPVQYGTRNDQHIVKLDPTVIKIKKVGTRTLFGNTSTYKEGGRDPMGCT